MVGTKGRICNAICAEKDSCNKTYYLFGKVTWEGKQYELPPRV